MLTPRPVNLTSSYGAGKCDNHYISILHYYSPDRPSIKRAAGKGGHGAVGRTTGVEIASASLGIRGAMAYSNKTSQKAGGQLRSSVSACPNSGEALLCGCPA